MLVNMIYWVGFWNGTCLLVVASKIAFFETVQRFCSPRAPTCCAVLRNKASKEKSAQQKTKKFGDLTRQMASRWLLWDSASCLLAFA